MNIDSIMQGAVDMHCHSYPEVSLNYRNARLDDIEALKMCRDYGMKGVVLKSHMFPTVVKTHLLQTLVPEINVYGTVTLNSFCGGLDPITVDIAANLGAKVIFMPTWTCKWDLEKGIYSADAKKYIPSAQSLDCSQGLTVLNEDGTLSADARRILELAKKRGLVVCTGHLSIQEGLKLCEEAHKMNFDKLIFSHPIPLGATDEDLMKAVSFKAYIEFTYLAMMPLYQNNHPKRIADFIKKAGPDHVILASDHWENNCPPPAEMMRLWVANLLSLDVPGDVIRKTIVDNPWKLLDIG
jgi:hypothetical protein